MPAGGEVRGLIPAEDYTRDVVTEGCLPSLHPLAAWLGET